MQVKQAMMYSIIPIEVFLSSLASMPVSFFFFKLTIVIQRLEPELWACMALAEGIMLLGAERSSDTVKGTAYEAMIREYNKVSDTVAVTKHTVDQSLQTMSSYIQQMFSWYKLKVDETVAITTDFRLGMIHSPGLPYETVPTAISS